MIVLIGSQKGGVGKSTLSSNLAIFLALRKKSFIVVDADTQASLSRWAEDRESFNYVPKVNCIQKTGRLKQTLLEMNNNYEYVLCDTAGRDSLELRTGLLVANLFLSPLRPTQPDLDTLSHLEDMFKEVQDFNENLKGFLVLSLVSRSRGLREEIEARSFLQDSSFSLAKSSIGDRKIFQEAMGCGKGVLELNNFKAKEEITKLAEEIF